MIRWVLALLVWLTASPLAADELRPVSISFTQVSETGWQLDWKQPVAAPDARLAYPQVPANCALDGEAMQRRSMGALIGSARVTCTGSLEGQAFAAPDLVVTGDALLRVVQEGRPVQAYRLTAAEPAATFAKEPEAGQVWSTYFSIGVEHILEGWDHLLFVIALVLLVVRGWPVVKAATAFTIAHSITLAAVTFGFGGLPQAAVEALIALSIVFLAVELARGSSDTLTRRWPWLVAFGFGLLHGFGFAGALREIGLPQGEVPAALVSFNLGVEAGQLLVIGVVLALRALLERWRPAFDAPAIRAAAYGIGIVGSYWLVERTVSSLLG